MTGNELRVTDRRSVRRASKEVPGLVIQERDRHLLHELSVMRVIDREQAKIVAGFGSTTRANTRLAALTRHGLIRRFFSGTTAGGAKALYTLSTKGAQSVNVPDSGPRRRQDQAIVADFFTEHQLAINEVYCAIKYAERSPSGIMFKNWRGFPKRPLGGFQHIPDGYVELSTPDGTVASFLEVDLGHERRKVWSDKVRHYLNSAVSGAFEKEFHEKRFRVLVIAESERRLDSIRGVVRSATDKIFWFATLESIRRHGCFASIWLRPTGEERVPLIRVTP